MITNIYRLQRIRQRVKRNLFMMTLYRINFFHPIGLRMEFHFHGFFSSSSFSSFFLQLIKIYLNFFTVMKPKQCHTFFHPVHSHVLTPYKMVFSKKTVQKDWTKIYHHLIRLNRLLLVCHEIDDSNMPATYRSVWQIQYQTEHNTKHLKC